MLVSYRSWTQVPRKHSYMVPSPPNSFGARLRQLRLEHDVTQDELKEKLGLRQSSVSKWERGEVKQPSPESIAALERFFGVPAGSLAELAEADQRNSSTWTRTTCSRARPGEEAPS